MTTFGRAIFVLSIVALTVGGAHAPLGAAGTAVVLATTTSTQDSGLLDVLVPMFESQSGYTVKTVAVGTGQALALAARGEADVTLAHAPTLEKKYVADGKLLDRRLVMYNDFVIAGPPDDPARIREETSAASALKKIFAARARFVSRGDNSGTHVLEMALWRQSGLTPKGAWYVETGQGMGATLSVADERRAYTLSDRATYLAFRKRTSLVVLLEGDRALRNVYSVMRVNPANGPRVNERGGRAFWEFMLAPATQDVIRTFGVDRYGQPLFVPLGGQRDDAS
jgi:tungstate transport system substrate-binding protein